MKTKKNQKKVAAKNSKNKPVFVSEHILDRDKNSTYTPNDESIDDLFDSEGHENFIHPNHRLKKNKKR